MLKQIGSGLFLILFYTSLLSQTSPPFNKGVNLSQWFQANSPTEILFRRYVKQDFMDIQSLGADVIRLPINLEFMTNGAPDYTLDPIFLGMLDEVIDWAEELNLHLILDNHTLDPNGINPNLETILKKIWLQMATRYEPRSTLIYYEIFNEPHNLTDPAWNAIQQAVINEIRTVDTKHTIIVGGSGFNGFANLALMPVYTDNNLIYTFHFYEPFIFTHQGAFWPTPSLANFGGMPFPYNLPEMPPIDPSFTGTFLETQYNDYSTIGTVAKIQEQIDIAYTFQQSRNVPVYCGEFGVYLPNSDPSDRIFWYDQIQNHLETRGIAWTTWDYHGGFGLFENSSLDNLFNHDLNTSLVNAIGFSAPTQTPFTIEPDEQGLVIYDDYIGENINNTSFGAGTINFFSNSPSPGLYHIDWTGAAQFEAIRFDFVPNRDFSALLNNDFFLEISVKGNIPNTAFDIRFEDTDTGVTDRPWRISKIIDQNLVNWNGQWQILRIPLKRLL